MTPSAQETADWSKILLILRNDEWFAIYNSYKFVLTNLLGKIHIYHYYYIKYILSVCISTCLTDFLSSYVHVD